MGWKKTSGSNVFKNVGKKQGVLTGLFDVAKGYLVVFLAQKLGFSLEIQVFSGLAAIVGHNWSIFLKFSGGRGIGTFGGVVLAFSPQILGIIIIPFLIISLIWNAAIGTLFILFLIIFLFFYPPQFLNSKEVESCGLLTLFSLFPIFLKRLSPLKELKFGTMVLNRLIFDDNEPHGFRINKFIAAVRKGSAKPIKDTLLAPPQITWKVAQYGARAASKGAKVAKDGFRKYLLGVSEKQVLEINAFDFKNMMIAASKKIVLHQEDINKINVFPVADKDTGYNLAATLLGIEGTLSQKNYGDFRELAKDMNEAAMINARGNVGMISTGYFVELLERIKHLESLDAFHLAFAMQRGIKAARESIAEPVEGTILDAIEAAGEKALELSRNQKEKNIIKVLDEAYRASQSALEKTPEKLKILKENNVVDAGALGFVKILEGWLDSLKGNKIEIKQEAGPAEQPKAEEELKLRYEVVALFKRSEDMNQESLKEELSCLGDSLEVIASDDKIKFHIHCSDPDLIVEKIKGFPDVQFKVEDMQSSETLAKNPLGLIVDSEIINSGPNPSFKDFLAAYQRELAKYEKILVITVSSKKSGSYSAARIARSTFRKPEKTNIYVFDSFTLSTAEKIVVLKARELIGLGKSMEEIIEELKVFCLKIRMLATPQKDFSLIEKIGFRPLFELKNGAFKISKIVLGSNPKEILAREIKSCQSKRKITGVIYGSDAKAKNLEVAFCLIDN